MILCTECRMVHYCCRDHQTADWAVHRDDCRAFRRMNMRAKFYNDDDILHKYPLKPPPSDAEIAALESSIHDDDGGDRVCSILGCRHAVDNLKSSSSSRSSTVHVHGSINTTHCCGNDVHSTCPRHSCRRNGDATSNNAHQSCEMCNHIAYTLCGVHGVRAECRIDKRRDWRCCRFCTNTDGRRVPLIGDQSDYLWRGLNCYNVYPLMSSSVPRRSVQCVSIMSTSLSADSRGLYGAFQWSPDVSRMFCK